MPDKAISNTSPLLYLYRCGGLEWLPRLFNLVCVPRAVRIMLEAKSSGLIGSVKPVIHSMEKDGMWISEDIRRRVIALAGE